MKKGFTLVELLGVITVIAILTIIAFPPIINQINRSKNELSDTTLEIIYSATELWIEQNQNTYPLNESDIYCITLQELVDNEMLQEPIQDAKTGQDVSLSKVVKVEVGQNRNMKTTLVDSTECTAF